MADGDETRKLALMVVPLTTEQKSRLDSEGSLDLSDLDGVTGYQSIPDALDHGEWDALPGGPPGGDHGIR